ncbi:MAG TPA: hypothetical protein VMT62_00395 [Syntrophorhabdaceae bacterium]|nr:hypothetical protein [Syntrophorhabdaceae bacterium]
MACIVRHDSSVGIIEVVCVGRTTAEDLTEAETKRISLEKETGVTRTLIDVTKAQLSATTLDWLDLPRQLYESLEANRRSHVAFVMPTAIEEHPSVYFYQTACRNRGWTVEVFSERKTAIDWLLSI